MAMLPPLPRRFVRAAAVLLAGWLVLEYALMTLLAARFGWGLTLTLMSVKGGLGLVLVGLVTARGFRRLHRGVTRLPVSEVAFPIASAVLIALPGLVPALFGLALFAPSLRAGLLRRFSAARPDPSPREIDLDSAQYRELRLRRLAKRPTNRRRAARTDALETKPPSV